ncbi:MAG TPA: His/Gly/Thr/Pro-type tRNA ligase C-terminal domain-containing protein, partial [Acidimicrobiales bacterium]
RLPPALAPSQVVVLLIKEDEAVRSAAEALVAELRAAGIRVRLDDRTSISFGRRSVDWELKGVPVRVEIGPRDLAEGNVTLVTRHNREKKNLALAGVAKEIDGILDTVANELRTEALELRRSRTVDAATLEEAIEAGAIGFARLRVGVLGDDGEDQLAKTALSVRCLQRADGSLAEPGDNEADLVAVVGRSY